VRKESKETTGMPIITFKALHQKHGLSPRPLSGLTEWSVKKVRKTECRNDHKSTSKSNLGSDAEKTIPYSHSHDFKLQIAGFRAFSSRLCSLEFLVLFFQEKRTRPPAGHEADELTSKLGLRFLLALTLKSDDGWLKAFIQ